MTNLFASLESRRLLSVSIVHGTLIVNGSNAADTIALSRKDGVTLVTVNGSRQKISRPFSHVIVNALAGNDNVFIASTFAKPVTVFGGKGDDTLVGNSFNDRLYGGAGNDTLSGEAEMHGGSGDDILTGSKIGQGNMYGDSGNDTLNGNGDVIMDGGSGDDRITHGFGYAILRGGSGNDTLTGNNYGDTLDYSHQPDATQGVTVNLTTGVASINGSSETDTIIGFAKVMGTSHDDTFIGRGTGFPADDEPLFIHGNGGADTFSDFSIYDSTM